jgi:hypothetical protein
MHKEEILCLAVLPDDVSEGRRYAQLSLDYTFDRMAYGGSDEHALRKRLEKIIMGKMCEATLVRFLRSHGIAHTTRDGQTPHTDPDRFDLRILNRIVDLKTFSVPQSVAVPERLLNCLALVPDHHGRDQWSRRQKYARFVFGFLDGRISIRNLSDEAKTKQRRPALSDEDIIFRNNSPKLFLTAAPALAESESKFHKIRRGTRCPQYPGGTRIDNMGCRVAELTSFREFINL